MQKKINIVAISLLVILIFPNLFSQQELFIPRNIQSAYEKGTRSLDGRPGAEYWQNSADYKIEVEVDPSTYQIDGSEEIIYYNNSPDTLKRIVLRLYPNIFKGGSARDYSFIPEAVNDGVIIKNLIINGDSIDIENHSIFSVRNTLAIIYLKKPIPPDSESKLSIDWNFKISDKVNQ